jgi:hypothetical protein
LSFKKDSTATERARSDVTKQRNVWIHKRLPIMRAIPHRLVFIDETSTSTKLTRLRGRSLKDERLPGAVPFGHWQSQTFIAALRSSGLTAPWLIDGAIDRDTFDLYVETQLAPTLEQGEVVILDNLKGSSIGHSGGSTARTWRLVSVPATLLARLEPDRDGLRKTQSPLACRRCQDLRGSVARSGNICELFDPRKCWNFLKHAAYASD